MNAGDEVTISDRPLVRVVIRGRLPNIANARMHFMARHRASRERKNYVGMLAAVARNTAGLPVVPPKEPRRLTCIVYMRGRIPDSDNLIANAKFDVDALVEAGWIPDDRAEFLPSPPELIVRSAPLYPGGRLDSEWTVWEMYAL